MKNFCMLLSALTVGTMILTAACPAEKARKEKKSFKVEYKTPIITTRYSADPSARVFDGRLYLYPSHDRDQAQWWDMEDYCVYSTKDMRHFRDEGVVFNPLTQTTWAKRAVWAPDCVGKDGKYYLYYPTDQDHVGVAVGDSPVGPFKDPLGKPLITRTSPGVAAPRDFIDPCVFIDEDGSAYLFVGQNALNIVKLNDDMISWDEKPIVLDNVKDLPYFFEAIWMHKYNGKYYLSYSTGRLVPGTKNACIGYAMADNITGPYEYKGEILGPVNSYTNHHSIVEFKGKWYLFYHTSQLSRSRHAEGTPDFRYVRWRRSVCVAPLHYNADGTIQPVVLTKDEGAL